MIIFIKLMFFFFIWTKHEEWNNRTNCSWGNSILTYIHTHTHTHAYTIIIPIYVPYQKVRKTAKELSKEESLNKNDNIH